MPDSEAEHQLNTPVMPRVLTSQHFNNTLVMQFFVSFARAEFALKQAEYVKGNKNKVEADWDRFAIEHNSDFETQNSQVLASAIDYMLQYPPRKQVLKEGKIVWVHTERGNAQLLPWLLILVRRVRNNLFHGGKFP